MHKVQQHHEKLDCHQDEKSRKERRTQLFLGVAEYHLNGSDHGKENCDLDISEIGETMLSMLIAVSVMLFCGRTHVNSILIRLGSGTRG